MADSLALYLKDVSKCYGSSKILNNISLKVERGIIYSLLGSSGCGKTTLLSCIVGTVKYDYGNILIFGKKISGSPAARVGYMPQNKALVNDFTVQEAVYFFGKLFNMGDYLLSERYNKLKRMLDLPPDTRLIHQCSEGQQRRVSLAVAMIHKPELLLLDDPSVGADPILRDRIWKYLQQLTRLEKTTIMITTHYIEEARQAYKIGLMRGGRLLVEESPNNLLRIHNCSMLEDIFLIICQKDESILYNEQENDEKQFEPDPEKYEIPPISADIFDNKKYSTQTSTKFTKKRIWTLLDKNWKQIKRNKVSTGILMTVPLVQMVLFLMTVGGDVKDIPLAIVNDETKTISCPDWMSNETVKPTMEGSCHLRNISCRFLKYLEHPAIKMIHYDSLAIATHDIKEGKVSGILHMINNLSQSMEHRITDIINLNASSYSEIQIDLDMSNLQIGGVLKYKLLMLYGKFQKSVNRDCHYAPDYGGYPVKIEEYMYKNSYDPFIIYLTPGLCLQIVFFLASITIATTIVDEKCQGIWDRMIVAGITTLELIIAHFVVQAVMLFFMTSMMILIIFTIFQQNYAGSLWLIFFFIYTQGLCGFVLGKLKIWQQRLSSFGATPLANCLKFAIIINHVGLLVSLISKNHSMANIIITGLMNPITMLSGVFSPLETMPRFMQIISKFLPLTLPVQALRDIIRKGSGITYWSSSHAVGVMFLWVLVPGLYSAYMLRMRK